MTNRQKIVSIAALTVFATTAFASQFLVEAQSATARVEIAEASADEETLLKQVFPNGEVFSAKEGNLPHHKAYTRTEGGDLEVAGFVFMTNEVEPDEWAYESRIELLVGLTKEGTITGVKLIDHYEPFGYFSIEPEEFVMQFDNKSILDPFEEGNDIDTVARATISIESAARVIRKGSRKIVRQYLSEERKKQNQ